MALHGASRAAVGGGLVRCTIHSLYPFALLALAMFQYSILFTKFAVSLL